MKPILAILIIIAGIGVLIAGSYLNSKIEALRADTDRTYAMAQRLEQRFINNKMIMLEKKWQGKP